MIFVPKLCAILFQRPDTQPSVRLLRSCWCEAEGGQGAVGVAVVVALGGGDVVVAGESQDAGGQVAEGGHCSGPVPGSDLGCVLAEGHVSDVVEYLDGPVAADPVPCQIEHQGR